MNIEITVKRNGNEIPLSDISTATFEKLKAEKKCKKEEPKELGHGDYGYRDNKPVIMFKGNNYSTVASGKYFQAGSDMVFSNSMESHTGGYAKLGNIFDDLERNSKDLEEFEVKWPSGNVALRVRIDNPDSIMIKESGSSGTWMGIKETQEHHQLLGQLIATAKRREAKKDC